MTFTSLSDEQINLGTNIQNFRKYRQYTLKQLSVLLNYDRGCLANLEKGKQNIEYHSLVKISRTLDIAFPLLFSENLNHRIIYSDLRVFSEDDYLLIFIDNFKRNMFKKGRNHLYVYTQSGIPEATVSRIMTGKEKNPTLHTLIGMSKACSCNLESMFTRNM